MRTVILIPWRGGDPWREQALDYVRQWYAPLGFPVVLGDSGDESFNRGASHNAAARSAGDWDVALNVGADILAELDVVRLAVARARETGKLVLPHDDYLPLTEAQTLEVLDGTAPGDLRQRRRGVGRQTWALSGALVFTHAAFDTIGGYDPNFVGWGWEDTAFYRDAERTVGVTRLPGAIWHLWHPRDAAAERADFEANTPRGLTHVVRSQV